MSWRHTPTPRAPAVHRQWALATAVAAVVVAAAGAGLALALVAIGGQPVAVAALLAALVGCEYAVLTCRERRRAQVAGERLRLREDLVATVSHELRSPLAPIRGWASTLLEHGDTLDDEERRLALESILRQARRLERLVVNLLEASKIESGRRETGETAVDATTVVTRVVDEFRAAWPARRIELSSTPQPCLVLGRELWIEQILSNLLSNALKYAPLALPIEVFMRDLGGPIEVAVVDHGPGIPADQAERVFGRFERLDREGATEGTGLGLYIARRLAAEIGARLTVTAAPDGGSRFALTMRRADRMLVLN